MRKFIVWVLCLAMVFITGTALAWGEPSTAETYQKAVEKLKDNQYAEAAADFAALGAYEDAPRYAMYCAAIAAGESGQFATAVTNLGSLNGFLDSALLASYYTARYQEANEDYEGAAETLSAMTLFKDSAERLAGYPEKMNARDYRKAEEAENAGQLEEALAGFKALGDYQDSAARAAAVQEKINARDYAAADKAEQEGKLETALEGFKALGSYQDSPDRVTAVQEKINARGYAAADKAEQEGKLETALEGFTALGDYQDSKARAAAVKDRGTYAQAMAYAQAGKFSDAYKLFDSLGDFEDSEKKAYVTGVTTFARVEDRGDGVAIFKFHDQWGVINVNTNTTVSPNWDEIGDFNQFGLAKVKKGDSYGYINTDGEVIIDCKWYDISDFSADGLCTVVRQKTEEGKWDTYCYYYFGLADKDGNIVTNPKWRTLGKSYNSDWGKATYINSCYLYPPYFSDGKTMVENDSGWGFLDVNGQQVGEMGWSSISNFSEGFAVVCKNDKYGYIDANGNVVIEAKYDDATSFSEGLAAVEKGDRWGYIDQQGNVVIDFKYITANSFEDGTADVNLNGVGWQIIDKEGKLLYFLSAVTPTPVPTATPAPTATPTPAPTDTPMATEAPTAVPTNTPAPTATPTPAWTEVPAASENREIDETPVYYGRATGFGGEVDVYVKVENGAISDIAVETLDETQGYGTRCSTDETFLNSFIGLSMEKVAMMIAAGEMDVVSGATVTSTAVYEAVYDALSRKETVPGMPQKERETSSGTAAASETKAEDGSYPGEQSATEYGVRGSITAYVKLTDGVISSVRLVAPKEEKNIGDIDTFTSMFIGMQPDVEHQDSWSSLIDRLLSGTVAGIDDSSYSVAAAFLAVTKAAGGQAVLDSLGLGD